MKVSDLIADLEKGDRTREMLGGEKSTPTTMDSMNDMLQNVWGMPQAIGQAVASRFDRQLGALQHRQMSQNTVWNTQYFNAPDGR